MQIYLDAQKKDHCWLKKYMSSLNWTRQVYVTFGILDGSKILVAMTHTQMMHKESIRPY